MAQKSISLLGSTGSVGIQALQVIKNKGFNVTALSANSNIKLLEKQAREYKPEIVCIYNNDYYSELKNSLNDTNIKVTSGPEGLIEAACVVGSDIMLNALVGMVGLTPTLNAVNAGKDIALANKETLVAGGGLVMSAAKKSGVKILPVDSEHSAIFQCLQSLRPSRGDKDIYKQVKKLILTASGGPFYGKKEKDLQNITVNEALNHPNWSMGAKITIDSATLMNKGLELIEAAWLFEKSADEIDIVVHRESIIHSAVEFTDNSIIAQMGIPDMKIPIQYALTYPYREECGVKSLNLAEYGKLTFALPDEETFICLKACREAMKRGGLYPALINGANEKAVELFLQGEIPFVGIGEYVYGALDIKIPATDVTVDNIVRTDEMAREYVLAVKNKKKRE